MNCELHFHFKSGLVRGDITMTTASRMKRLTAGGRLTWRRKSTVRGSVLNWSTTWREKVKTFYISTFPGHEWKLSGNSNLQGDDGNWHFVQQKNTTILLSACFVLDFTYEFIQRSGLREPIIFEKPEGLGIKYLLPLLLMCLMCVNLTLNHL